MINKIDFAEKALDIANNYDTLYIMGGFGGALHAKNKTRAYKNSYNCASDRKAKIEAADDNVFGFDCIGLVKTIIWGWCGDKTYNYGGAAVNYGVCPDVGADSSMNNYCYDVSNDFSFMDIGEMVWMTGHVGIYVGDGLVVEASPKWKDGVQITSCDNIAHVEGLNGRTWTKHGKLPWVDYNVFVLGSKCRVVCSATGIESDDGQAVVYADKDLIVVK